jgi:hypothetical protein
MEAARLAQACSPGDADVEIDRKGLLKSWFWLGKQLFQLPLATPVSNGDGNDMASGSPKTKPVIYVAIIGNVAIALIKFLAAAFTGNVQRCR